MYQYPVSLARRAIALVLSTSGLAGYACGGAEKTATDTTSDTRSDTSASDVTPPADCYLPDAPTASMDCALMCEKVEACGIDEADCLSDCLGYAYLLAPEAGPRVESCFVDLPCNQHPAAFGAIGCVARVLDDASYTPPAGNAAACGAIVAKAEACGLIEEVRDQIGFLCDRAGHALAPELMGRANACVSQDCVGFQACLGASSCFWDGLVPEDEIPEERDACLNGRDTDAIGTSDVVASALTCVDGCSDGTFTCAQSCLTDTTNLTGPCSTCFAVLGRCMRSSCGASCSDPSSSACYECQATEGCATAFRTCAGRPVPGGPDDQLDCTEGEQAEIRSESMVENVAKCVRQCSDGKTCNDECMETLLFVEERCFDCAGDFAVCAGRDCANACANPADQVGCYGCLVGTTCLDGFAVCSGVVVPSPPGASCLGTADKAAAEDGSAWAATLGCTASCAGEAGCIATCVGDGLLLSTPCETCYSGLGVCMAPCRSACASPASAECAACYGGTACGADFVACGGMAPYDAPPLGDATCDQTVACAVACSGVNSASCVEACIQGAEPSVLGLARSVTTCLRTTCQGRDVSCLGTECLTDFQVCHGIVPTLDCGGLDGCLGACLSADCQADCFVDTKTVADVDALLDRNTCTERFCGVTPSAGCIALSLNDLAFCAIEAVACAEPELELPPYTCREAATCFAYCPDQACADACIRDGFPSAERTELMAHLECILDECDATFNQTCMIDKCWPSLNACVGEPGFGLDCIQIMECQNTCSGPSCFDACIATASGQVVAAATDAFLSCVYANCTGPDGRLLDGCAETVASEGGTCGAAYRVCADL